MLYNQRLSHYCVLYEKLTNCDWFRLSMSSKRCYSITGHQTVLREFVRGIFFRLICAVRRRRFCTEEGHEKYSGGSNNQFSGCLHHMQQSVYNFHISFIVGSDRTSRQLMYRLQQCRSYCSSRLGAAIRDPIFMFLCHSCCNDTSKHRTCNYQWRTWEPDCWSLP